MFLYCNWNPQLQTTMAGIVVPICHECKGIYTIIQSWISILLKERVLNGSHNQTIAICGNKWLDDSLKNIDSGSKLNPWIIYILTPK